jgi:ABC-type phosphate transport system substrate-binding protein
MRSIRIRLLIFFIPLFMGYFTPAFADESLAIITQKTSPLKNLSSEDLKRIYLRKSLLDANGNRWIPLNLPVNHVLRLSFSLALFNTTPEEQEQYWNEQYFQGVTPPEVLASEEAVLRFVAITPGAIGYVYKRSVDNRVKVLTLISAQENN